MASVDMKELGKDTQFKAGEKQAEKARKAGIASGVAKRKKKSMKEDALLVLSMAMKSNDIKDLEEFQSLAEAQGANLTVQQLGILAQTKKMLKGDTKAFETIMLVSGQKPSDKIDLAAQVTPMVIKDDVTE